MQKNRLFESDCEILKLRSTYLALSVDSISEEIYQKLYKDPFTWGWMTVMSSVSDLAASATEPIGLLLSSEWKFGTKLKIKSRFFKGVNAALKRSKMALLGGDSGVAAEYFFSATAVGEAGLLPLMRKPAKIGDYVCLLGRKKLGIGPALALRFLRNLSAHELAESLYRPEPNIQIMKKLRLFIRASIDTSDGLAASLNIISKLNNVGFQLKYSKELMHPRALQFCRRHNIHPLVLWMGDLGDYQTLVFVPPEKLAGASKNCAELLVIGRLVKNSKQCLVDFNGENVQLPLHLLDESLRDLKSIRRASLKICKYFE